MYFHDDESLLVNLFVPSEVVWRRSSGDVTLVQETRYPATDRVQLTVRDPGNGRFAMKVRVPAWSTGATLRVNGNSHRAVPGEMAIVRRSWKAGDVLELVVPQPLRTLVIAPETPNLAALMRGAVMYVGLNPWDGLGEQRIELLGALAPVPTSDQAYRATVADRDLVFVPYFTVDTERYNTYFRI